ncbi:MAG: FxsB family radical SAM/SPASM domain protein [Pseudonocardiales bacterium]|nr:FxsB family radical SAM/SPASM domain protein [Pseudonocardiales bacterium]
MYELADQTWRLRPRRMPWAIADQAATRIAEHIHAHSLAHVTLILHGGEPLLAGPDLIAHVVTAVREAAGPRVRVDVSLQTNGVGLDAEYLRLFDTLNIRVGVSLDGDAAAHDRHRRYRNGRGSYPAVVAALERLAAGPYRHVFGGLLCTIDVRNDPVATYEALLQVNPPMIDLLLPHGTWTTPPPERVPGSPKTPYADWLIAVFDRWFDAPRQETRIRLFEEIMYLLVGGASATEAVGLSPVSVLVIETDGSIEQSDMLKSAYHGAPWTGLHVTRDPFDAALLLPSVVARQIGVKALATECRSCRIRQVCGGGLYPHRYRSGSGFANPSVYCPDLFRLITHIRQAMVAGIATRVAGRR